eukprot:366214-Chlamydomonas_euryale.AAC.4
MAKPSPPPKPSGPATDEEKLEILRAYPAFVFDLVRQRGTTGSRGGQTQGGYWDSKSTRAQAGFVLPQRPRKGKAVSETAARRTVPAVAGPRQRMRPVFKQRPRQRWAPQEPSCPGPFVVTHGRQHSQPVRQAGQHSVGQTVTCSHKLQTGNKHNRCPRRTLDEREYHPDFSQTCAS